MVATDDIDDDNAIFTNKDFEKLDEGVRSSLFKRYAKSTLKGWNRPVKDWHAYCKRASCSPIQITNRYGSVNASKGLEMEQKLMRFAYWLQNRKLKGRKQRQPLSGRTIEVYISSIKAWHLMQTGYELGEGFKMKRMRNLITSFKKKTEIKRKEDKKKGRVGIAADEITRMKTELDEDDKDDANVSAAMEVCWQGLIRGGEVTSKSGNNSFNTKKNLTRADVVFYPSYDDYTEVRLRHPLFKCENRFTKQDEFFIFPRDDSAKVNAARALHELFSKDRVDKRRWKKTPLFRNFRTDLPIRDHYLRRRIRQLYEKAGCGLGKTVGLHIFRIGGASTLMAIGTSPIMIQALGRWSSDIYGLYMRQCKKSMIKELRKMGKRSFSAVEKMKFDNHSSKS